MGRLDDYTERVVEAEGGAQSVDGQMNFDTDLPLAGVSVLEISSVESVQYAGRLLGALGADVKKLEPIGGDPLRTAKPLTTDGSGVPISLRFEFFNAGKSSAGIVPDFGEQTNRERLVEFMDRFDVVLTDGEGAALFKSLGRDDAGSQIRVVADIYGEPIENPVRSSPLTRFHASTTGSIVPAEKDDALPPSWAGPNVFECMHGTGIAVAVLAELRRLGGGVVDYSIQAYGVWLDKMIFPRVAVNKTVMDRRANAYPFGGNLRCRNGFVTIFVIEEKQWIGLCQLVGEPSWIDDPRFADGVARVTNQEVIDERLTAWCREHTIDEVMRGARKFDVPCGVVRTIADVTQRQSSVERDFVTWQESLVGRVRQMRLPFGSLFPQQVLGDAPPLRSGPLTASRPRHRPRTALNRDSGGPLAGLKVLDFTWAAAGPIVTSYMAWLGADIVKVEYRGRPDLMRAANRQYGYPGDQDLNSSPSFNEIAAGKRSIELDLRNEVDRRTARRLALVADVMVENMRPGKIETLGFGYEEISKDNPQLVMCSVSATGRSSEAISGYAPIFWAEGGGAWLTGWPSANPGVVRGPVDLHVAAMATMGTLALLWRRDRTGSGGYVDCSGIEAVATCIGEELLEYDVTGQQLERSGNAHPGTILNGLFPTSDANYVAITIYTPEQEIQLLKALDLESTKQSEAALYRVVAEATRTLPSLEIEQRLQHAGLASARVRSLNEALLDPVLNDAGVFQRIHHERIGEQTIVGLPWRFQGAPYRISHPAHDLGEDTGAVLRDWLNEPGANE